MKLNRILKWSVGIALMIFLIICFWPSVHRHLIRSRIVKASERFTGPPFAVEMFDEGIKGFDPPAYVYQVLWELATEPTMNTKITDKAGYLLIRSSDRSLTLGYGDIYSVPDWDRAFDDFIQDLMANKKKRSKSEQALLDALIKARNEPQEEPVEKPPKGLNKSTLAPNQ